MSIHHLTPSLPITTLRQNLHTCPRGHALQAWWPARKQPIRLQIRRRRLQPAAEDIVGYTDTQRHAADRKQLAWTVAAGAEGLVFDGRGRLVVEGSRGGGGAGAEYIC